MTRPTRALVLAILFSAAFPRPASCADEPAPPEEQRKQRATTRASSITNAELQALAESQYLPPVSFDYDALLVLRAAGERGARAAERAVADERMLKVDEGWGSMLQSAWSGVPAERRVALLPALTRLYREGDPPVRRQAAGCLPSVGDPAVPLVSETIRADDAEIRKAAIEGLRAASRDLAFGPVSRARLFDAITEVFPRLSGTEPHPFGTVEPAAYSLVHLDRDRAVTFLADPARWRPDDRPAFGAITRALVHAEAVLPGERILRHLDALRPLDRMSQGDEFTYGFLLRLLARSGHPGATARVEADAERFSPARLGADMWFDRGWHLCNAVGDAVLTLNGLDAQAVGETAFDAERLFPTAGLAVPQPLQDHLRVKAVSVHVWNAGVRRYVADRGHELDADVAALERIGAVPAAAALRNWVSRYGDAGRSSDAAIRKRAAAGGQLGPFDEEKAQRAILTRDDDLDVLLARHAVRHKGAYREAAARLVNLSPAATQPQER